MHLSRFSRRRRQLGAVIAGLCVAAGSVGSIALADSGASASVSVEASVFVQAGMNPISAGQAAANVNSAIDAAAESIARSAVSAAAAGHPVRTTATAAKAFANEVDAALCEFATKTVAGLKAAGVSTTNLLNGTLAALGEAVKPIPGAVTVTLGAEIAIANGTASASINPAVEAAFRQSVHNSVQALRPILPLTRLTVRQVAGGVKMIEDASAVAYGRILRATVNFTVAVFNVSSTTMAAMCTMTDRAVAAVKSVIVAVDAALDNLSDVNLIAQVDAGLSASVH
jgi:hypothetical protein